MAGYKYSRPPQFLYMWSTGIDCLIVAAYDPSHGALLQPDRNGSAWPLSTSNFCRTTQPMSFANKCKLIEGSAEIVRTRCTAVHLEGRCLQRLEASETPLGVASNSP